VISRAAIRQAVIEGGDTADGITDSVIRMIGHVERNNEDAVLNAIRAGCVGYDEIKHHVGQSIAPAMASLKQSGQIHYDKGWRIR